ncbi:hypothetical protein [Streptomyces justiciae]|uniref:hypothetical protein n=1 Tax=Streptomyces justiciae TaxID=2780140 RepID=UPI0018828361|nr:hypothetical protein [Streptomyces justiciae]MBE8470009.1 hypothetical protein [Streptomyces justiciae]
MIDKVSGGPGGVERAESGAQEGDRLVEVGFLRVMADLADDGGRRGGGHTGAEVVGGVAAFLGEDAVVQRAQSRLPIRPFEQCGGQPVRERVEA